MRMHIYVLSVVVISHHPTLPPDEAPHFIIPSIFLQVFTFSSDRALVRISAGMS